MYNNSIFVHDMTTLKIKIFTKFQLYFSNVVNISGRYMFVFHKDTCVLPIQSYVTLTEHERKSIMQCHLVMIRAYPWTYLHSKLHGNENVSLVFCSIWHMVVSLEYISQFSVGIRVQPPHISSVCGDARYRNTSYSYSYI